MEDVCHWLVNNVTSWLMVRSNRKSVKLCLLNTQKDSDLSSVQYSGTYWCRQYLLLYMSLISEIIFVVLTLIAKIIYLTLLLSWVMKGLSKLTAKALKWLHCKLDDMKNMQFTLNIQRTIYNSNVNYIILYKSFKILQELIYRYVIHHLPTSIFSSNNRLPVHTTLNLLITQLQYLVYVSILLLLINHIRKQGIRNMY